ncbi:MAG: hypothetical protein JXA54_13720 [Candidatus Heimdallarchaeota archaeon]|nr:hypothetical protein [Candidatus Heimdallarchaeota archaeon]
MSTKENDLPFSEVEEGKTDELKLELKKEEKETKAPIAMYKIILIFAGIFLISSGIAIGLARLIYVKFEGGLQSYTDWIAIMFLILGGMAVASGGVSGVWGGQRNIPIRMVSPSDASVIGKGLIVTGYVIEDCLDNEIEFTIYDKDKEPIYEALIPLTEDQLFYLKLENVFDDIKKSTNIYVEAWMVSIKSKRLRFMVREKKYENLNIYKKGFKIGKVYFFPWVYRDFTDKIKAIFDPKRKEKGMIENVKINKDRTTNIFYPSKDTDDAFVPFSFKKIADIRQNAIFFDIKRKRRLLYSLLLFLMSALYFIYPLIFYLAFS